MLESVLKSLLTGFLIRFSRFRKPMDLIDYRIMVGNAQRILIHLPAGIESERVRFIQEKVVACFPTGQTEFLIHESFPAEHRMLLQADHNDSVNLIGKKDVRFFRTLKKNIIQMLKSKQFDLILDFNDHFDITFAHAFRAMGAPVIVGLFVNAHSDVFYNLLIQVSDVRSYDQSLFRCLSRLR
jgi:hypothetical protein